MIDLVDELKTIIIRLHAEARTMPEGEASVTRKAADAIAVQAERLKAVSMLPSEQRKAA